MLEKLVFVAMKFNSDSWNDKPYKIIREVADEAGFRTLRSDEITTSGAVVDEVCQYLSEAELVVVDTTGDSQSVSYELGYCHGVKRSPGSLLLLRKGTGDDIPFNYRHFRNQCYRDLRHLRQLLRRWFDLSIPLTDDQLGYTFVFDVKNEGAFYGEAVAQSVIQMLHEKSFTGRCEYYVADGLPGSQKGYRVSLGLKFLRKKEEFSYINWVGFQKRLAERVSAHDSGIKLVEDLSELGEIRGIRRWLMSRGVVEFEGGLPVRVVNPDAIESDSWFIGVVNRKLLGEDDKVDTGKIKS